MSAATLYLALAVPGFGVALSTNLQARRLGPLVAPYFLFAWIIGELAPHALHLRHQADGQPPAIHQLGQ